MPSKNINQSEAFGFPFNKHLNCENILLNNKRNERSQFEMAHKKKGQTKTDM